MMLRGFVETHDSIIIFRIRRLTKELRKSAKVFGKNEYVLRDSWSLIDVILNYEARNQFENKLFFFKYIEINKFFFLNRTTRVR